MNESDASTPQRAGHRPCRYRFAPRDHASGSRALAAMLQTWADTGYGLWALQGMALAFGMFRAGRGESLVPLALGALFVSAGLLVACLRLPRRTALAWLASRPRHAGPRARR